MRINASATFSLVRETAKSMLGSGTAGAIVVLSSVAAKEARLNSLTYNASKLAVLHWLNCSDPTEFLSTRSHLAR
ncbi:SDR family NAD(P)-dependent oxidoreductase [Arthrobacter sp. B6]|uniref:SDR family NAD(P)-dependent oxidoreductase n=1 Tax=Arthrobacter sp. B6 TaxID=1570137 RepID=UPI000AB8641E|nr:SDR family NAD(P)-dependent oxidoreductase [Arthrobacter sp. B6]